MKHQKWVFGPAALALVLSAGSLMAQDKPAKKARAKRDPNAAIIKKEAKLAEDLAGKPLTEDQQKQLAQAVTDRNAALEATNAAFKANRARILGTTVEALDAKEKELKAKAAEERKKAAEAKKAAG